MANGQESVNGIFTFKSPLTCNIIIIAQMHPVQSNSLFKKHPKVNKTVFCALVLSSYRLAWFRV